MYALREHIDWLYRLNLIPILPCQDLQIPGEGCGITGDIDDTGGYEMGYVNIDSDIGKTLRKYRRER